MKQLNSLKEKVLKGGLLSKEEALELTSCDLTELREAADEIRKKFCKDSFELCTVINAKSGRCSEDCKFCAQSSHYDTNCEYYPLLDQKEIVERAIHDDSQGILGFSLVTSGRNVNDDEIEKACGAIREIRKKTNLFVCASMGLLTKEQYAKLKEAGLQRVHNNLETSPSFFKNVCSTHTTEDKIAAIQAARSAGLSVCSGGIMGLGESMEDRIELALKLRDLSVTSVPVNFLNPIAGTPMEHNKQLTEDEILRVIAIFRFILPTATIRLAGGRGLMKDKGEACFTSGANAAISGDMLTTSGVSTKTDLEMLHANGYQVRPITMKK